MITDNSEPLFDWRSTCPISCALDVLGDRWSLLIIRDLIIFGTRTYTQFGESAERISTNVLACRLKLLVQADMIRRVNLRGSARGNAYALTESGKALAPVLTAYKVWAGAYLEKPDEHLTEA